MKIIATCDNVILQVPKVKKTADELLIEEDKGKEKIIMGTIVATGPSVDAKVAASKGTAFTYKSRVAVLPWETDDEEYYVVKEENIYGILE